eukprot:TRINITY_DN21132_c0_g1_i1.p1 TRINITY_DN21132_c0_g1~~TRINITY_DN21132_c0_g1_i1.p1  ORF type:complete len:294 (+),score=43.85 TRINITY_DN21132_c0_g1_i1:24-884(+)
MASLLQGADARTVSLEDMTVRPLLARPWVSLHNPNDLKHVPAWLSPKQQTYARELFARDIHAEPILVSATLAKLAKSTRCPQVAFAGRSNVGKSSLMNMMLHGSPDPNRGKRITERQKLRMPTSSPVSEKPGRTRHLFRFEIGGCLTMVDLPGYGFAAASRGVRQGWASLADEYFDAERPRADMLQRVVSLVDAKVGVKESDEQLWEMLQQRGHSIMVVLTKADKVSPHDLHTAMVQVLSKLDQLDRRIVWPYVHAVSGLYGHGVEELKASLSAIASDFRGGVPSK